MKLDTEEHRKVLLHLIRLATFPGALLDEMLALRKAIESAELEPKEDEGETVVPLKVVEA